MNWTGRVCYVFKLYRLCAFKENVGVVSTYRSQTSPIWQHLRLCHTSQYDEISQNNSDFDVMDLADGDEALEKRLKVLILEIDILRQEGARVPALMGSDVWKELLNLESRSGRKNYLLFCWKKEMMKGNHKKKKEAARIKRMEYLDSTKNNEKDCLQYGLGGNTMFMRVRDSSMNNFYAAKLMEAMQFGQELVVDCGYDQFMTKREAKNCGKQLMLLFSENRVHVNPFNLYFCNIRRENCTIKEFEKFIPTVFDSHFPLNITEKSYLDLFPKERLVYLTPHCREELVNYDHEAVYILGGMVDKSLNEPLSLARAKEQGLKMAKLPLDQFLHWGSGSGKSLTLNQMILIMLDIRLTGDWKKALVHVPSRKIQKMYQVDYTAKKFRLAGSDGYREMISKRNVEVLRKMS